MYPKSRRPSVCTRVVEAVNTRGEAKEKRQKAPFGREIFWRRIQAGSFCPVPDVFNLDLWGKGPDTLVLDGFGPLFTPRGPASGLLCSVVSQKSSVCSRQMTKSARPVAVSSQSVGNTTLDYFLLLHLNFSS